MGERHNVYYLEAHRAELSQAEYREAKAELDELDEFLEPFLRRAEDLRRKLNLLPQEDGLDAS